MQTNAALTPASASNSTRSIDRVVPRSEAQRSKALERRFGAPADAETGLGRPGWTPRAPIEERDRRASAAQVPAARGPEDSSTARYPSQTGGFYRCPHPRKVTICGAFAEPTDGLEPSTFAGLVHFATGCHWLRTAGLHKRSIPVAGISDEKGISGTALSPARRMTFHVERGRLLKPEYARAGDGGRTAKRETPSAASRGWP